jgi:hypothetical protein
MATLGRDEQRLRVTVSRAWDALMLSDAMNGGSEQAWILAGEAAGAERGAPLLTVTAVQQFDRMIRPFYWTRQRFIEIEAEARLRHWSEHGNFDESWFSRWVEIDDLLCRASWPALIAYALLAHGSAWTRPLLEFSVPEFVRAAEGILALAKGMGATTFRERALRIVPALRNNKYVGGSIDSLLLDLYQLRSDCVHGKIPFAKMQARGDEGEEQAAQLAYVAEVVAREALLVALRRPDKTVFESREALEQAWACGTIP